MTCIVISLRSDISTFRKLEKKQDTDWLRDVRAPQQPEIWADSPPAQLLWVWGDRAAPQVAAVMRPVQALLVSP